jgi:hypothetical protein
MIDMESERPQWIARLDRVARPVLANLANRTLRQAMPVEQRTGQDDRATYTHLEAFGRLMCGLVPWLAVDPAAVVDDAERRLHAEYHALAAAAIASAVLADSPDRMNFERGHQPLVDAAFLAHAVVRAPAFFGALPKDVTDALVAALRSTRDRKPIANNWLLFAAMIEAGLHTLGAAHDPMRVDYAVRQHEQWYKGGGVYGDGPQYHADYYNSFVIQPMLIDVLRTLAGTDAYFADLLPTAIERGRRYAEILERSVAPDGSFPPTGRSIAYRCGVLQHLAQVALQGTLPKSVPPPQARGVLGAAIRRTLDAPGTFDTAGWLRIGLSGHQPALGEGYISTGSLYLAAAAFLPLGLGPNDPFWSAPPAASSWQRAWGGVDLPADVG